MSLARLLYDIYFQDSIAYAEAYLEPDGSVAYRAVKDLPTMAMIEDHIAQGVVLGSYTVSPGNTVRYLAWDIDSKIGLAEARKIAKQISDFLTELGVPHAVEFSGSKGYHIDIFLEEQEKAERAKRVGDALRDYFGFAKTGQLHVEVYPKQAVVEDGKLGSLLRVPLGRHPKTNRPSVFVNTTDWEDGAPLDPEKILSQKTNLQVLEDGLKNADPLQQIANELSHYWSTGQRHDITLCTAGMCASSGMVRSDAEDLITRIHKLVPEGDLKDQLKAVETTYQKYAAGEKILGENGLAGFVPAKVLMKIRSLMGASSATLILQSIDSIRLEKNPAFVKVRNAAHTVVAYLKEHGRLVRDESNVYWLNFEDSQLTMIDSYGWTRLTNLMMGINVAESFGRQVAETIRHKAYEAAKQVVVLRRSHWDGKYCYINLGGPEIYILKGEEGIEVVANGEIDVLFRNADDTMHLPNLLEEEDQLDPWKILVDDVNFADDDVSAHQQRQFLKAAICNMFFPEAMPTRPIIMILGASGSGKTTTARRILWGIEGPNENVLGQVPDKPDALRASLAAHRMVVIDNIEKSNVSWLPDTLNRASTGSQIELRELHTTNRVQKIIFNVFTWLTGTEIPFSDEAVFTRILPLSLKKLDDYVLEEVIQSNIASNFNALWKGLLFELNKVVVELNKVSAAGYTSRTRLADFAGFCYRIKDVDFLDGEELMKGFDNLVDRQREVLKEYSPFVAVLDGLIKTRPDEMKGYMSITELFAKSQRYATLHKQRFDWTTAQALASHMRAMEQPLAKHFGMIVKTDRENGREVKKYKFNVAAANGNGAHSDKTE